MKKAVALVVASALAFAAPALAKSKVAKEPVQTGPRQFIQTVSLNGIDATITIVADWSEEGRMQAVISNILSDLSRVDQEINGTSDGEIVKINALPKGKKITLSDELFTFLTKARDLANLTDGWFDITRSSSGGWFSAKNYHKLALDSKNRTFAFEGKDMQIDISNIWPAYLADKVMDKLVAEGITNVKVEVGNVNRNIGQDIYTPWNVSVDIPNPNSVNAYRSYVYSFSNKAVASLTPDRISNPIIDPRNNQPVLNNFKNVTVFGGDSMTASAFAVALYTLGPKDAPAFADQHPEVKGIFVNGEGNVSSSSDLTITHPNYADEQVPGPTVDRGPNDLRRKKLEEEKD